MVSLYGNLAVYSFTRAQLKDKNMIAKLVLPLGVEDVKGLGFRVRVVF